MAQDETAVQHKQLLAKQGMADLQVNWQDHLHQDLDKEMKKLQLHSLADQPWCNVVI